jgi:GNAT superfamily N-acetyltransferase
MTERRLRYAVADGRAEHSAARKLVSSVFAESFGIRFVEGRGNPSRREEPWPDRYLVAWLDGKPIAASGILLEPDYLRCFGGLSDKQVENSLAGFGMSGRFDPRRARLLTTLAVTPEHRGTRIGTSVLAASLSRAFLDDAGPDSHLVIACVRRSMRRSLFERNALLPIGLGTFAGSVGAASAGEDPMEALLLVPPLHVPPGLQDLALPGEYAVPELLGLLRARALSTWPPPSGAVRAAAQTERRLRTATPVDPPTERSLPVATARGRNQK